MEPQEKAIQDQVRLPLSVAFEVVLQGLKTRLGRSIVTITGVVLGIAFLMSILSGGLARQGVSLEMAERTDVKRMLSFLTAECGPLTDRTIAAVQVGPMSVLELRFFMALLDEKPTVLRWTSIAGEGPSGLAVKQVGVAEAGNDVSAVLVVGAGRPPVGSLDLVLASARRKIVAYTSGTDPGLAREARTGLTVIELARKARPDEVAKASKEARKAKFRSLWIILISLAVTVIGITNAMLMSVTERFREIGTMKCLGALSSFIRKIFLIESSLMGAVGGLAGSIVGAAFSIVAFGFTYGFGVVFISMDWLWLLIYMALSIATAVLLSILAALYPANFAARMVPAMALRTNV